MIDYVAPYITEDEYQCSCCHKLPPDFNPGLPSYAYLFNSFRRIREEWGKPLKISSGYRCPSHNKAIGGSYLSVHMFGLALDIDVGTVEEVNRLFNIIVGIDKDLRIGKYTRSGTFIHIDCGWMISPRASHDWEKGIRWNK